MKQIMNYMRGATVLMAATVAVKFLGAIFKIPLTNILGMEGMGYYSAAYQIFGFVYGTAMAGLPAAVASQTAAMAGSGQFRQMRRIGKMARLMFPAIGLICMGILFVLANPLAQLVGAPKAAPAVAAIAPTVFFSCWMGSYKGYDQGLGRMGPTALSQVTEGVARPILGLVGAFGVLEYARYTFAQTGIVFGQPVFTEAGAVTAALPYAAAAAVGGVAIAEACAAIVLLLCHRGGMDRMPQNEVQSSPPPLRFRWTAAEILRHAAPLSLSAFIVNITNMIDLGTIYTALTAQGGNLCALYGEQISGLTQSNAGSLFYGAYQTAMNIYWLVPSVTAAFGAVALPKVAAAAAVKNRKAVAYHLEQTLSMTNTICMAAGLGLVVLAQPVLELLYGGRGSEILPAVPALKIMGAALCVGGISGPCVNILQGMGKGRLLMGFTTLSAVSKLILNSILVQKPQWNISGAAASSFVSTAILTICCVWYLIKYASHISLWKTFFRPLIAAGMCAVTASAVMTLHPQLRWWVLPSIGVGAVIWYGTLWLMGADPLAVLFRKKKK